MWLLDVTRDRLFSESAARALQSFPRFCVVLVTIPQLRGPQFLEQFRLAWALEACTSFPPLHRHQVETPAAFPAQFPKPSALSESVPAAEFQAEDRSGSYRHFRPACLPLIPAVH